jgi:hypothetical protein
VTRLSKGVNVKVRAVEETADTVYLVLPNASPADEGGEISDRELGVVAGGGDPACTGSANPWAEC